MRICVEWRWDGRGGYEARDVPASRTEGRIAGDRRATITTGAWSAKGTHCPAWGRRALAVPLFHAGRALSVPQWGQVSVLT